MADKEKPKRIIGMRSRVVIGNEVPEDDSDTKVLGQDVLVHVKPDQLEEGMEIVGVASTVVVGGSSASELIQATMERAKELDLPDSKKIIDLGKSALSAQDEPTFKTRLAVFIEQCKSVAPLAVLVVKLVEAYAGM